jgi:hypothetical protein
MVRAGRAALLAANFPSLDLRGFEAPSAGQGCTGPALAGSLSCEWGPGPTRRVYCDNYSGADRCHTFRRAMVTMHYREFSLAGASAVALQETEDQM